MYASSVYGKSQDTATMSLPSFKAVKGSSLRFKMYLYGGANVHVMVNLSTGAQINFVAFRSPSLTWNDACLDLEEAEVTGVSFTTGRSVDPYSLIAIDEIFYNDTACPGRCSSNSQISIDFSCMFECEIACVRTIGGLKEKLLHVNVFGELFLKT